MSSMRSTPSKKTSGAGNQLVSELAVLRQQREDAIRASDFAKVRALDCHVERMKEEIHDIEVSSQNIKNSLSLDLRIEEVKLKASTLMLEKRRAIFHQQTLCQEELAKLNSVHEDEFNRYRERYTDMLELEAIRRVPESELLTKQAQFNARVKRHRVAQELADESEHVRAVTELRRQEDVQDVFDNRRMRIEARHASEEKAIIAKFGHRIKCIEKKFELSLGAVKNSLAKTASDLRLKLTDDDYAFLHEFTDMEPARAVQNISIEAAGSVSGGKSLHASKSRSSTKTPKSTAKTPRSRIHSPRTPI